MTDNRFVELDRQVHRLRGHHGTPRLSGMQSWEWSAPFAATDRVLVVLIENGGVDLGIPDLVDRLLALIPGASMLPDSAKTALVNAIRDKLKSVTNNLLETAELTLNRYTSAKPDPFGDVIVLRDGSASYDRLKQTLTAQRTAGRIVDIMILTHGSSDIIWGQDRITGDMIRAIKTAAGRPLSIRSVYMMNCVGSSLNQAWIDAGAKVSCGTLRNNFLPEPTTYFFWTNWKAGQSFETAATSAYRQTISLMNDTVRDALGVLPGGGVLSSAIDFSTFDFVTDSAPVVQGQRTLTISSDDLTFSQSQSRASTMATTVLPISVIKSLSENSTAAPGRILSPAGLVFIRTFEPIADGDPRIAEAQQTITDTVSVALTQNQIDALVSFIVGVGPDAFRGSTLLEALRAGRYTAVPDELRKWTKTHLNGTAVDHPELVRRRAAEADLFARGTTPAVSQSMGAVNYAVPGTIPPLLQASSLTCWATVIAMMTSWRRQQSVAPRDAIAPGGQEFLDAYDNNTVLTAATAGRLYQALGLVPITSLNPSIDGWDQLLRLYGPLYVDIGYPSISNTHAIIVTGLSGDGTAAGTTITYIDPALGSVVNRAFAAFLSEYEAPSAVNTWPYVITHWPATQSSGQSLPARHTCTYESSVGGGLAQAQFAIAGIAVADAIQIGLGAVAVAQAGVAASYGTFQLSFDKAQRLLTSEARAAMPGAQTATQNYRRQLFFFGNDAPNQAKATVIVEWQGNAYGEIGTPMIRLDLDKSTEWTHSSAVLTITKLDRIPPGDTDPRAYPIVYSYNGNYDPAGNGYFDFSGEFQLDAFGAIKWNRHEVVSRSALEFAISGRPDQYVVRGPDAAAVVSPIPAEQLAYLRAHLP